MTQPLAERALRLTRIHPGRPPTRNTATRRGINATANNKDYATRTRTPRHPAPNKEGDVSTVWITREDGLINSAFARKDPTIYYSVTV